MTTMTQAAAKLVRRAPADRSDDARADEKGAIAVALRGTTFARWHLGLRALARLVRDPDDTRQVFLLAVVLDRNHVAGVLFRFLTEPGGYELLRDQRAIDSTTVDLAALQALPRGTLGHEYARHLLDRGLDADMFQAPPDVPPALAYLAQRVRQSHDVWHVLAGYGVDISGEIALQGFTFGQLRTPAPGLTALAGALRFGLTNPRILRLAWDGYRRGRDARFLLVVPWEDLWAEPVEALRRRLGVSPARVTASA